MQTPEDTSAPTGGATFTGSAATQAGQSPSGGQQPGTSGLTSEVRSDAQQLGKTAGNRLHSEIDARKGTVATQAQSVSSAIDKAAGELGDAPQWLKSAFQQGAQQVQRFAETLERKDSREILNDIQTMARNNPGTFLAACAAVGFAAARVFKAGSPDDSSGSYGTSGDFGAQQRQPNFPPPQIEEPMFRQTGGSPASSTSTAGEFA
jgi:hypothetical protein